MKKTAIILITLLLAVIPFTCHSAELTYPDARTKILCIGNSFTRDAIFHVPALMKESGIDDILMVFAYYPGRKMAEHCDWSHKDYTVYVAEPGSSEWKTVTGSRARDKAEIGLEEICRSAEWDIITFQEFSGARDAWEWTDKQRGYFRKLFDQVNACLSKPVIYYDILTQSFYDMKKFKGSVAWGEHDTAGMFKVVAGVGEQVMKDFPEFKGIISTAAAVENLRTTSLMNEEWGLSRDGFHLDYGVSRCAAACTFFETVITPLRHKKLDHVKFTYSDKPDKDKTLICTPVTADNFKICLKAARAAIRKPYKITRIKN